MKVCEEHDDAIVVWDYGKKCPWCDMEDQLRNKIQSSTSQVDEKQDNLNILEDKINNLNDEIAEMQNGGNI